MGNSIKYNEYGKHIEFQKAFSGKFGAFLKDKPSLWTRVFYDLRVLDKLRLWNDKYGNLYDLFAAALARYYGNALNEVSEGDEKLLGEIAAKRVYEFLLYDEMSSPHIAAESLKDMVNQIIAAVRTHRFANYGEKGKALKLSDKKKIYINQWFKNEAVEPCAIPEVIDETVKQQVEPKKFGTLPVMKNNVSGSIVWPVENSERPLVREAFRYCQQELPFVEKRVPAIKKAACIARKSYEEMHEKHRQNPYTIEEYFGLGIEAVFESGKGLLIKSLPVEDCPTRQNLKVGHFITHVKNKSGDLVSLVERDFSDMEIVDLLSRSPFEEVNLRIANNEVTICCQPYRLDNDGKLHSIKLEKMHELPEKSQFRCISDEISKELNFSNKAISVSL